MITDQNVYQAMTRAARTTSFPVRKPGALHSTFWSETLTITRLRPIPVGNAFVDFLVIPVRDGYARIIHKYILESYQADALEFQWLVNGRPVSDDSFILTPGIDRHLNRFEALPYPNRFRNTFIRIPEKIPSRIRVRNLTQQDQYAYGAVFGWYYPVLRSHDNIAAEDLDDLAR